MAFAFIASTKSVSLGAGGGSTPAINTTGATLIVVSIARYTVGTPNPFTDSAGNTWINAGIITATAVEMERWYVINPTTSASHTFTETGSNSFSTIIVSAYSGISVVFDKKSSGTGSTNSIQPGSLTPTNGYSLIITSTAADISEAPTVDSGFTERETMTRVPGVEYAGGIADIIQGATPSAVNPAWSSPTTGPRTAMAMVFYDIGSPNTRVPVVIADGIIQQLQSGDILENSVTTTANITPDNSVVRADGGGMDVQPSSAILSDTGALTLNSALSLETSGSHTGILLVSDSSSSTSFQVTAYLASSNNIGLGLNSAENITTGVSNTCVGVLSGDDITTGTNNVFIGYQAGDNASQLVSATNSIAIGQGTFTTSDNYVVLGNSSVTKTQLRGDVTTGDGAYEILKTVSKTSNFTITNETMVLVDATSGDVTITLPTASSLVDTPVHIKKTDSSSNSVIIDGNGSETIDGNTTLAIYLQYTNIMLVSDGTEWWIL